MKMSQLVLAAVSFCCVSAWACPDFSGNWGCQDDQGEVSQMTVTQNGQYIRVVSTADGRSESNEILADGATRERLYEGQDENGQPFSFKMMETASCMGNAVNVYQESVPTPEFPFPITIHSVWSKVSDTHVAGNFTVNMMGEVSTNFTNCTKR